MFNGKKYILVENENSTITDNVFNIKPIKIHNGELSIIQLDLLKEISKQITNYNNYSKTYKVLMFIPLLMKISSFIYKYYNTITIPSNIK